jgi:hypothetical protein
MSRDITDIITNGCSNGNCIFRKNKTEQQTNGRCNCSFELFKMGHNAVRVGMMELVKRQKTTSDSAVRILSATFCEKHQAVIAKMDFSEFQEWHTALGCPACNVEILNKEDKCTHTK